MGTLFRAAAYSWAAGYCTTQRAIIHIYSVGLGPLELGRVMTQCPLTSSLFSIILFSKEEKRKLEVWLYSLPPSFWPKVYFQCLSYGSYP
jgi:hypothetical protein